MAKRVYMDTLRSLGFASISASYAAVGAATSVNPRIAVITNNTQGDVIFSDDNTVAAGKMFVKAGTSRVLDFTANTNPNFDDNFVMAVGVTMYVKQVSAPTSGAVYIEYYYG